MYSGWKRYNHPDAPKVLRGVWTVHTRMGTYEAVWSNLLTAWPEPDDKSTQAYREHRPSLVVLPSGERPEPRRKRRKQEEDWS